MRDDLFLGVDGGQSHTEAVLADATATILGRGRGGPSNHADEPGGRERLRRAVADSVSQALRTSMLPPLNEVTLASVHCGMTGGAKFKEEVIRSMVRSRCLSVGHDAPAALAGATGCKPGIIVIAGTGSVAYAENASVSAQAGGWGYLFGDEGGGFGIALQAVRHAAKAQDSLCDSVLLRLALEHFKVNDLHELVHAVYSGRMTRDEFASFALPVHEAARSGVAEARRIIAEGTESLVALASAVARKARLAQDETQLYCAGGMFRGSFFSQCFRSSLQNHLPGAQVLAPRFEPVIGALLLAYRAAGVVPQVAMLSHLDQQCRAAANEKSRAGQME